MNNPLNDLSKLSEPITKLIDVVSKGIGIVYRPIGTVRQAKADTKAMIIKTIAKAEALSIEQRAQQRLRYHGMLNQQNIEQIVSKAIQELPDKVSEKPVNQDWIIQFFNHAKDVCDEDMQTIWARILAGETSAPNSYAKRTLDFLKTMEKREAEAFTVFCSFAFTGLVGENNYLIFDEEIVRNELINKLGPIDYINHFHAIGLINTPHHMAPSNTTGKRVSNCGIDYTLVGPEKPPQTKTLASLEKDILLRTFTQIGNQLARIAGAKPIEGFVEKLSDYLKSNFKVQFSPLH